MLAEVPDAPLYNTAAVVQRTGVPATTIRAWERRYGYPKPHREPDGQRLYSERDIQAIRWLADQTAHGVAISRAVTMLRAGHAASRPAGPSDRAIAATPRSFDALRADLGRALLSFEAGQAESLMSEAFALFSVEDVCLRVLEPLLVEVGDRWHSGQVSIGEEHYVSAFIRARLFSLLHAFQQSDGAGSLILAACVADEWHEVGILLVSVFLARRGYQVRYLGPNLPLHGLAPVVARHHPALVVLSAQSRETARSVGSVADALGKGPGPHAQVAFGGQAFNAHPTLRESVDGTYAGPDAATAVDAIAQLLNGSPGRAASGAQLHGQKHSR